MTTHTVATREAWLDARLDLLAAEKDLTRRSDEVAGLRQRLPWVRVDKTYTFDTEAGSKTLKELFDGRSQLLVYHFMFGPDYKAGCPSCSMIADGFNGFTVHLANHDVALMAVSRAPLPKLTAYKQRMAGSAVRSLKQNDTQPALNVAQPAAQGRLADVQSLRRLPEAAVL